MSNKNIIDLPSADETFVSDQVHVSQGGVDKKLPVEKILERANGGSPFNVTVVDTNEVSIDLTRSDLNKYFRCTNTSEVNQTFSILTESERNWKIGDTVTFRRDGTANVLFVGVVGVTINDSSSGGSLTQDNQVAQLLYTGSDRWDLIAGGNFQSTVDGGGIQFADVANMVAGNAVGGGVPIDPTDILGHKVSTVVNNQTSKSGGVDYIIKTAAQAALDGDVIDGTGAPSYYGGNHAIGVGDYVAIKTKKGYITAFQSGAAGDGSTDDMTAIQHAIDYLGDCGGGKLYFDDSDYYLVDNFVTGVNQLGVLVRYSNVSIEFQSKNAVLKTDPSTQRRAISVQYDTNSNPAQTIDGISIRGGKIDGMNTDPSAVTNEYSHGINVRRCSGVTIEDMDIVRNRGDQIFIGYGADTIRVQNCNIDGQAASSVSGVRQGIAVLSGRNIWIQDNKVAGCLLGIDLECDQNQINFGHDFLESIWVENNKISDMSSEGFGLITPLVASPISVQNIFVNYNEFENIDETVMDFDIDETAGGGKRIQCIGNTSDGSNTFKGISVAGISDSVFSRNIMPNNQNIGLQVGERVQNVQFNENDISSLTQDAVRVQESTATERLKGIQFNGGRYATVGAGSGIEISGAFDVTINGGEYIGVQSGITARGSSTAGAATDLILDVDGGVFECTDSAAWSSISDTDLRSVQFSGTRFVNAAGAAYNIRVNSGAPQPTFLSECKYQMGDTFTSDARLVVDNQANPDKVVISDAISHENSSAELNDIAGIANTVCKFKGKSVWNTSLGYFVYTTSSVAGAVWVDSAGVVRNTPV